MSDKPGSDMDRVEDEREVTALSSDKGPRIEKNYFPEFTGVTRFLVSNARHGTDLCDMCSKGLRNFSHPVTQDQRGTTCPGLSYAPSKGKAGSAIKPRIAELSAVAPVRSNHAEPAANIGNFTGGLAYYWRTSGRAVTVHRVDPPSDSVMRSQGLVSVLKDRLIGANSPEIIRDSGSLYIYREALVSGVTTAYKDDHLPLFSESDLRRPEPKEGTQSGAEVVASKGPQPVGLGSVTERMSAGISPSRPAPLATTKPKGKGVDVTHHQPSIGDPGEPVVYQNGDKNVSRSQDKPETNTVQKGRALLDLVAIHANGLSNHGFDTAVSIVVKDKDDFKTILSIPYAQSLLTGFSRVNAFEGPFRTMVAYGAYMDTADEKVVACLRTSPLREYVPGAVGTAVLDDLLTFRPQERVARLKSYIDTYGKANIGLASRDVNMINALAKGGAYQVQGDSLPSVIDRFLSYAGAGTGEAQTEKARLAEPPTEGAASAGGAVPEEFTVPDSPSPEKEADPSSTTQPDYVDEDDPDDPYYRQAESD